MPDLDAIFLIHWMVCFTA